MLDRHLRPLIDPPLNRLGRQLARAGVGANAITAAGLVLGLAAAALIVPGHHGWALLCLLGSRLADGLDGAVARATRQTDFGGYFDILSDFMVYAAVPLAFVLAAPAQNGSAGAALLAAFYINAASFFGVAILAAKRGVTTTRRGPKAWYHDGGLMEGSETIGFFVAFCLFPGGFVPLAWIFALLCLLTATLRLATARWLFSESG